MTATEHTQVALKRSLPSMGLESGAVGVVVHTYGNGDACEVEFLSQDGNTIGVFTVKAADLLSTTEQKMTSAKHYKCGACG